MNEKTNNYKCAICGREHVKLWRPYMDTAPLICATCAEERQSPKTYSEVVWKKNKLKDSYIGTPTKKKIPLPKWIVDDNGKVPSYDGPGPDGTKEIKTDQLIIDLSNEYESYSSKNTTMIPAVPYENNNFWGYTSVPEDLCEWWRTLPTR